MANGEHRKKVISLVIRKTQMKTTIGHYYIPIRMDNIKKMGIQVQART